MTTAGGATLGYCEIGNCVMATPPKTRMNSAITHAKMGRSMKKRGMRGPRSARGGCGRGRCGGGGRRGGGSARAHAGTHRRRLPWHRLHRALAAGHLELLEAVDHDLLASLQATEH